MKQLPKTCRYQIVACGLLFGLGLLTLGSVNAQELLQNPGFESALGPTNWTLGYLRGGPDDFELRDRDTVVKSGYFGVVFRPMHDKLAHAYFTQTVTNLDTNHFYTVSGWMWEEWWKDPIDNKRDKFLVYIEAIGGTGDPMTDGRASVLAATTPDANIDAPYTYPTSIWRQFTVQQKPDARGKIEIRLHMNKLGFVLADKLTVMNGYFDDISLTY